MPPQIWIMIVHSNNNLGTYYPNSAKNYSMRGNFMQIFLRKTYRIRMCERLVLLSLFCYVVKNIYCLVLGLLIASRDWRTLRTSLVVIKKFGSAWLRVTLELLLLLLLVVMVVFKTASAERPEKLIGSNMKKFWFGRVKRFRTYSDHTDCMVQTR